MLEGLSDVRWADLSHAYGSAGDVPDLLRALTSDDAEARDGALDCLYGNIWHQGTVYEATSHAVPFLIEIASAPTVTGRAAVLELLAHLARGSSYLDAHQHLSHVGAMLRERPDFEEQKARELADVERAARAVASGHVQYLALLDDRDAAVGRAAAKLLSVCAPADVVPRLMERAGARTGDPPLRATILFSLAKLDGAQARPLLETALSDDHAIVRLSSSLALAFFAEEPPPRAFDVIAHHLEHLDAVDYSLFPHGDDQAPDLAMALTRAAPADRRRHAETLLQAAERGAASPFAAVPALLALAFGEPLDSPTLSSLDPVQRRVLQFVAHRAWSRRNGNWSIFANFSQALAAYGLEALGHEITGYR